VLTRELGSAALEVGLDLVVGGQRERDDPALVPLAVADADLPPGVGDVVEVEVAELGAPEPGGVEDRAVGRGPGQPPAL
jgi:hypothetical protein